MSTPLYLGEITIFAGNFAPAGFALCDGTVLQIAEYKELFTLIGTTYGGNGTTTFALPDLRGRMPIHFGNGAGLSPREFGESDGVETVKLTTDQLPSHTHNPRASRNAGNSDSPTDNFWAKSTRSQQFKDGNLTTTEVAMNARTISATGANKPHDNMPPFLPLNFIIALNGFPPNR